MTLQPSTTLQVPKSAPVAEFGGLGRVGGFSAFFYYASLVKATSRKSLQVSKASKLSHWRGLDRLEALEALAIVKRALTFAALKLAAWPAARANQNIFWVLGGLSLSGAEDRDIRLVSRPFFLCNTVA